MKSRPFATVLAALLTITLIAPSALLITPQKAHAIFGGGGGGGGGPVTVIGGPGDFAGTLSSIKNTVTAFATPISAAAEVAQQINAYVLQPLAFVLSGNLLKLITASVIDFVIGKTNGTGAPQFVQNLQGHMQTVGDTQATAFFAQFGRNSNSPFAASITSSLRTDYLQKTSAAGFWAANQSTLARSSPNVNGFLAGDWSGGGGVGAWFALTTQPQNNPYTLYQSSQSELASRVGSALAARSAELSWGDGFLSWCGPATEWIDPDAPAGVGTAPGDPCKNKDGSPGTIQTAGSTIKASLDSALSSTQRKLEGVGQLAQEVGKILGNVGTVLGTVNFASDLLGGSGSGGLSGVGQSSATNPTSRLTQFRDAPGYLGVDNSTVFNNAATLPAAGPDMLNRLAQYEPAWNSIGGAANAASTALTDLINVCTAATTTSTGLGNTNTAFASARTAQAAAAQTALTTEVAPVVARAAAASAVVTAARAMVQKVQNELKAAPASGAGGAYLADIQALQAMPPTIADVANVQHDAQAFGTAAASPTGSLTVSGGSVIDQMSLISTNAVALKSVCTSSSSKATF